jgi:4-hydroxy-tetrahydrodipicolinate reductase
MEEEKMKDKKSKRKVKVILYGLGVTGTGMGRLLLEKEGIEIVGAICNTAEKEGKDLGEILGTERKLGVKASRDVDAVLSSTEADVVLHGRFSFVKDAYPEIVKAVKANKNVISIAEELAYPYKTHLELDHKIDRLAKQHGVTVLATGANPGFMFDTLILTLTGVCHKVERIKGYRSIDITPFAVSKPVLDRLGIGFTPEAFVKGSQDGTVVGHPGFAESMTMVADTLGWKIDEIKKVYEPFISKTHRDTPTVKIEPGLVGGFKETGYAMSKGEALITLEMQFHVHPEAESYEIRDIIEIDGVPPIRLKTSPGISSFHATVGNAVNNIPKVINAPPGLVSMRDLSVPCALLRDVRELV